MRSHQAGEASDRYVVRSVARALDLLDVLQRLPGGATLARLSESVGLPKSSTFRYLSTLESRGYVEQGTVPGTYRPGMRFLPSHQRRLQLLSERARPAMERLRDRFGETVNLAVLDGSRIIYVEILDSARTMRLAARVGDRVPVHSSALGKAICATLADGEVVDILRAGGMPRLTANTITRIPDFLATVERVRVAGHALDDREHEEDGRCVAVAITGSGVPAAISLSAPAVRFSLSDVGPVAEALMSAASEIGVTGRGAA